VKKFTHSRRLWRGALYSTALALAVWIVSGVIFCEASLRLRRRFSPVEQKQFAAVRQAARAWEDVATTAGDGVDLKGWFISSKRDDRGCVLVLHGAATSRASGLAVARTLLESGYSVLMPDSRAHGESGGAIITYGQREGSDVLRWAAWARGRGCDRLFGIGVSMGGVALIEAAAQEPAFRSIVAECPYSDLRTTAEERVVLKLPVHKRVGRIVARLLVPVASVWARWLYGLDVDSPAATESAARLRTPLLLIHGLDDTKIPPAHSRAIAAADRKARLWLVPGAAHISASLVAPAEFSRQVLNWFQTHASR
jgi:dipeptidyl aminopeptidase/acylaminoacyl peptidase